MGDQTVLIVDDLIAGGVPLGLGAISEGTRGQRSAFLPS